MPSCSLPLVGVTACSKQIGPLQAHAVVDKYLVALTRVARVYPVLLPAIGDRLEATVILPALDGLLLPGSPSNVDPAHYACPVEDPEHLRDPARDATTLPLIRAAVAAKVPVIGICRGHQELVVATGGALIQDLARRQGRLTHFRGNHEPPEVMFAAAHSVELREDGLFARLMGGTRLSVNSVHMQAAERIGPAMRVEARAEDGTIEAVAHQDPERFAVGTQWHPEWKAEQNRDSVRLFEAFGAACRRRQRERMGQSAALAEGERLAAE